MQDRETKERARDLVTAEVESAEQPDQEFLFRQVPKVLQSRRWGPKEGPFQGFGSPPGRF